jgi:hypothetical protein
MLVSSTSFFDSEAPPSRSSSLAAAANAAVEQAKKSLGAASQFYKGMSLAKFMSDELPAKQPAILDPPNTSLSASSAATLNLHSATDSPGNSSSDLSTYSSSASRMANRKSLFVIPPALVVNRIDTFAEIEHTGGVSKEEPHTGLTRRPSLLELVEGNWTLSGVLNVGRLCPGLQARCFETVI